MIDLMAYPSMIRNVMVAGHIHHGKTALMDMLVFETHQLTWDMDLPVNTAFHLIDLIDGISTGSVYRHSYTLTVPRYLDQIRSNVPCSPKFKRQE